MKNIEKKLEIVQQLTYTVHKESENLEEYPNQLEAKVLPYGDLIDKLKDEWKAPTEKDEDGQQQKGAWKE